MKSLVKGSNCVRWSQYTTLKISNKQLKHQTKVSAHFVFSPSCVKCIQCSCTSCRFPTGFKKKSLKNKSIIFLYIPKSEMSASECQVLESLQGNRLCKISSVNLQRWSSVSVRVPTVSDCNKFAVQILKDEALMPLLTLGLLFILGHLSRVHLATLKIHSISQTLQNFKQRTSLAKQSQKRGYKSRENPVLICISLDASMERLLANRYRAVWGFVQLW